jgi:hypothetical protein
MRKAFLIIFEKDMTSPQQRTYLHDQLTTDEDVKAWWRYISNTYIIITESNINIKSVREFIMKRIPDVHFLTLQITHNNYDGYLNQKAWDWMENTLSKI